MNQSQMTPFFIFFNKPYAGEIHFQNQQKDIRQIENNQNPK
jgi:hypothetical protein